MSSSKVKCTCGWSWNKSDSSKKDMYICHECGRDNSNNMKNGGWLDNYNDSEVSLPEGYVGEGYDTSGRDFSPAWGGQFEDGGLIPMAQNGRATRADSLAVYNNTRAIEDYYKKQGYIKERVKDSKDHKQAIKNGKEWVNDAKKYIKDAKNAPVDTFHTQTDKNKNIAEHKKYLKEAQQSLSETINQVDPKNYIKKLEDSKKSFEKRPKDSGTYVDEQNNIVEGTPSIEKFYLPVDENKFYQREQSAGFLDLRAPMPLYDKRIVPQYLSKLESPDLILQDQIADKMHKTKNKKEELALAKQYADLVYTDRVEMYEYEPLSVMPFDMVPPELQRERVEKYGLSGVPKSIIDAHPEWLENTNQPAKTQTLQPRVEALNLRPIEQAPINIPVQELDFNTPIKAPKSYNVSALRYNMKGPSDYYNYNQESVDYETAMRAKAASDAYNRDIEKRYGPQNEYRTPKSAANAAERLKQLRQNVEIVPQYQMGGSIPGSVGFTYARTNSPAPSNGPYAKKTMASAQNGQEMKYYQEGLDFKPKTISKDGSVIKDDMGQWDHPGEITEIGSNQITMQGVPYPVLGVSDEGDVQMMYPEEEYKFKGKKVTEFPMAKNGIRQEQKGLVNLDNLLNFTNYNTKQPGGWMDKYQ